MTDMLANDNWVRLLLGEKRFLQIFAKILKQENKNLNYDDLVEIRGLAFSCAKSWVDIAQIFMAVASYDPDSKYWLTCFTAPILGIATSATIPEESCTQPCSGDYWQIKSGIRNYNPEYLGYLHGTILGIFQAANWLDENVEAETPYFHQLPKIIKDLILLPLKLPADDETVYSKKEYQSQLSQAIKTWVRGSKHKHDQRRGQVQAIIRQVVTELKEDKTLKLSMAGAAILEQICYAVFGSMDVAARAQLFGYHNDDFTAIEMKPENIFNLALALKDMGEFEDAIENFREAYHQFKNPSEKADCLMITLSCLNESQEFDRALKILLSVLKLNWDPSIQSRLYYELAVIYQRKGMDDKAITALKNCLELDPDFEEAKELLKVIQAFQTQ